MQELYREGRIRAIGVSNFPPDRLMDLLLRSAARHEARERMARFMAAGGQTRMS